MAENLVLTVISGLQYMYFEAIMIIVNDKEKHPTDITKLIIGCHRAPK